MNEFRIKQKLSDLHLDILKRFNLKDRKESEDLWRIMREGVPEPLKSKFMEEYDEIAKLIDKHKADK